jgi:hypothetical protein
VTRRSRGPAQVLTAGDNTATIMRHACNGPPVPGSGFRVPGSVQGSGSGSGFKRLLPSELSPYRPSRIVARSATTFLGEERVPRRNAGPD